MPRKKSLRKIQTAFPLVPQNTKDLDCFHLPIIKRYEPLATCIELACSFPKNPYFETKHGQFVINFITRVAIEFWRQGFDPQCSWESVFPGSSPPPKGVQPLVEATATLWLKCLAMLERMATLGYLDQNPAMYLCLLIREGQLLIPFAVNRVPIPTSVGSLLEELTKQNVEMLKNDGTFQNPFTGFTARVVDSAELLACELPGFRKDYYRLMVQTCGAVVQLSRISNPVLHWLNIHSSSSFGENESPP